MAPFYSLDALQQNIEEHFLCPLLDLADGGRSVKLFLTMGFLLTSSERKIRGDEGSFQMSVCGLSTHHRGWCFQMWYWKGHVLGAYL